MSLIFRIGLSIYGQFKRQQQQIGNTITWQAYNVVNVGESVVATDSNGNTESFNYNSLYQEYQQGIVKF